VAILAVVKPPTVSIIHLSTIFLFMLGRSRISVLIPVTAILMFAPVWLIESKDNIAQAQDNAVTIDGFAKTCTIPLRPLGETGKIPGKAKITDIYEQKNSYTCEARIPPKYTPNGVLRFSNSFPRYVCNVAREGRFELRELIYKSNGFAQAICQKDTDTY
jgi:hypothetical protein